MNRVYRLVWSESHKAFEPAAETARRRGKRSGGGKSIVGGLVASALSASALGATAVAPTALPTAPQVTVGQATVAAKGSQMTVTEKTATAAINWGSFDIGSAAGVTFVQPTSSSVILNRVLSGDPSQIYGTLKANGIVFLINPQGVLVGKGAQVNVGGLVASTLNMSDKDLLSGNWAFKGSSDGAVSNAGEIHIAKGGFAALVGAKVENTGLISAKLGSVALASGNQATLDFDDAGLLKVAVKQGAIDALVHNAGAIVADGGRIILTAKSANDVLGTVVNNTGVLQSQSLGMRDGQVWLLAADPVANTGANGPAANGGAVHDAAGAVVSSGLIDVSGTGTGAGQVTVAGTTVDLAGSIKAGDPNSSAGSVLINSTVSTTLEAASRVDVSSSAAAGKVVVWSDGSTQAHGVIEGRGIGANGAGATVEVSAAHDLTFATQVELGATSHAKAGTLILDPATLEIAAGAGTASANTVFQNTLQTQSGNIVLSATGQITIDALTNNLLNLANASSLSVTSQSTGGVRFLNGAGGGPSGITTHNAAVSLTASGSGSIDNVGTITTNGGNIDLSGVYVHLAGGLNATNGVGAPGNVALSVFGGAILSSSTSPIAGGQVLLDATYGYIGSASSALRTATSNLVLKTGGNAFVANTGALTTLALTSNHLAGTPVGVAVTATNLNLTGADATGDGTMYSHAVRWTGYSAANPSGSVAGPTSMTIAEDGDLRAGTINLPQTALTLSSSQGYILGGNTQPITTSSLILSSPLGIGGTDFNGINAETDGSNPGAAGGNTLLTKAGIIIASVIDPSGNIAGIANLTQQGNLAGSVHANDALLQASGNIGTLGQPFALNLGRNGEAFNIVAGGNLYLLAAITNSGAVDNMRAGAILAAHVSGTQGNEYATFDQITAAGALSLSGTGIDFLRVEAATSTNGSINFLGNNNLEVDAATLNGTNAGSRSIGLTSTDGNVIFGSLSTNGPAGSAAATAPLGSISIATPQGSIYDRTYWSDPVRSELRAANATLAAQYGIQMYDTAVDAHANLNLTSGQPGIGGQIFANLTGIDSVSDPAGASAHAIHVGNAISYYGDVNINNVNGDLRIGSVHAYYDYGGYSSSGQIYLTATGSIVADGTVGGGRINAADLNGYGGNILLSAGANLGVRGTGSGGNTGAGYLSLSGTWFNLYTHGDLFVKNDQNYAALGLHLYDASSASPYFYHFTSADAAETLAGTPAVTFNAASSGGLLTVSSGSIDDSGSSVTLNSDGNIRVQSFTAGQYASLAVFGQNIAIDAPSNNSPAISMGDGSYVSLIAQGSLSVGNLASAGYQVYFESDAGNLTLGKVSAPNADVYAKAFGGDILGLAGNRVIANNLTLSNMFGAIGANPLAGGSIPINVGVAQNLSVSNQGGGGSFNLVTLNDPASLYLTLNALGSPGYAGANFRIAPSTTGLGLTGSANGSGITLATLGTTGSGTTATPLLITVDAASISIASGAGPQLGIGYDLFFRGSNQSVAANLSGSAGKTVIVHTDNNASQLTSLTGTIALTDLQLWSYLLSPQYSSAGPLSVNLSLAQPLAAFTLMRSGIDNDSTSFNGSSISLHGSGQSFTALESLGSNGSAPGIVTLNASSATAIDLTVNLQTAGIIDVGTMDLGLLGAVNLSVGNGSASFAGVSSAIEGVDGGNSITAGAVSLSAMGSLAGQATLGTSATPLNVNAANVALTSSGDIYVNTGLALSSLAVTASHPYQDTSLHNVGTSTNYIYQIGGTSTLSATDVAADSATAINVTAVAPLNFAFTSDRTIQVGTIDVGSGSVTLTANGNWSSYPFYNYTHIGIEQGVGGGITAGSVSLIANGYQGHAGTNSTALAVDAANLSINVNGSINVADAASLDSLSVSLAHSYDYQAGWINNSYSITAPNIALTLIDQYNQGYGFVALRNLTSSSLQSFSLRLNDASMTVGDYGGDFSGGQVSLGDTATVNLISGGSIWALSGYASYNISDTANGAVADSAVAIKAGTLNMSAAGSVIFSAYGGSPYGASLPVEVSNLSVTANGAAYITNVGSLNVVSANINGSGFFRAVEADSSTAASITGGSTNAPIAANDLTLVAYYGSIGAVGAPVITNTASLSLDSGADITVANLSQLGALSIISHHNKGSIGDISNGGLNSLEVTDASTSSGLPLALGVTDLGVSGGGYQLSGLNAPQLAFSFQTDTSISVGALTANSVALTSENAAILHIPAGGTITAGSVSLSTPQGQSVGASGADILVNAPNLTVRTGGDMYVADSATLSNLVLNLGSVLDLGAGIVPIYHLDNSAAAHPLTFDVTADIDNNVLDVNAIVVSRTDAPVNIAIYTPNSGIGVNRITDDLVTGGRVTLTTQSGNIFGLGTTPAGIRASTVELLTYYSSIGDDYAGSAAPVVVMADTVNVMTFADIRIISPQAIENLRLNLDNPNVAAGTVWSVNTPTFTLSAGAPSNNVLNLSSVNGATTNLEVDSSAAMTLGTVNLGSGALNLNEYTATIESDNSNGAGANITTTGTVSIYAAYGIGSNPATRIQTDIGGILNLSDYYGAINVDQVSSTPLIIGNLSRSSGGGAASPINITAASSMTLTNGLNAVGMAGSAVTLTAGRDITYAGALLLNGMPISMLAGGNILGGDIFGASEVSMTAAGTAVGSTGSVTVGNVDYYGYYGVAASPITVLAAGDITLTGSMVSSNSVSLTSTNGSIYGQSYGTFSLTPTVSLTAHGDIAGGSSAGLSPWMMSGSYGDSPGTFTLSAQAGGQINLQSNASVVATKLAGGGNVSLQVQGDGWHPGNIGLSFGQVSSANGSVYLGTTNGDITAIDSTSAVSAATSITLTAAQNPYAYGTGTLVSRAFNLGTSGTPLVLTAPRINLTANGNIYATVPVTGLTDLSVARTYLTRVLNNPGYQAIAMPVSTVLIEDSGGNTVFQALDGGWDSGGSSALTANYGSALNLSYAGNNAIQIGNVALSGGNLALKATNPFDISITSSGGLIQANVFSFNLIDGNQLDGTTGTATGGFGTLLNPIHTEIGSLSGSTVGPAAGVFINQDGAIAFTNLITGGDISVTTTRLGSANTANANIAIGNVASNGGSVSLTADGAIIAANGVTTPSIMANGPLNHGEVTLSAAAGINLPSSSITSAHGNVSMHTIAGGIDLTAAAVRSSGVASLVTLLADQGDITIGSINSSGNVVVTATTGAINGTAPAQNLTGLADGITAGSDIVLNAATGIGTGAIPLSVNTLYHGTNGITANTSGVGADIHLVAGGANPNGFAYFNMNSGGDITLGDYYSLLLLNNLQAVGDIKVTQQNHNGEIVLHNVVATGAGAILSVVAPYGNISSYNTSGNVSASRIVLNALGDASAGTLGMTYSPVNVDAQVVIAVASGNISLNSVATGATKMPLVASNGFAPTVSITAAGDFLVGQIVAGQQGTVNITSAANILDDQDSTTRIYAGTVNLTAADAIGTLATPVQMTAIAYNGTGAPIPGSISAASTTLGNIYLNQAGAAILQSLVAADGSINVTIADHALDQSRLVFANTAATDQAGNDINVTLTNGDLTVARATAGMTAGTVNLHATAGSLFGDGRADCCTIPNVSGNSVNLTAQTDIGSIAHMATLAGTAMGIQANQSTAVTHAAGSQIYLQYVGDVTVGSAGPNSVSAFGSNAEVLLAACGTLTLDALNLTGASLGLSAGTGGSGGSILDGIAGGASKANPDVTAASITFGAATNVGDAAAPLWVNAATIAATAASGGIWINDAATTPVTVTSATAAGGPVVIGSEGNLLVGAVNAGSDSATLSSIGGAVLDGRSGGSTAIHPNVTAGSVIVNAATSVGSATYALWVNAATLAASATSGGVWINDAASTPVTVTSVTAGGAAEIGSQGDLLVERVTAASATLNSAHGAVLDGIAGGSSASHPNVIAGAVTVNAATNAGSASDALWVDAAKISAAATGGGVWINDAASGPVTLASITAGGGPVVIGGQGDLDVQSISTGGDATLISAHGGVLNGTVGGSSASHPNITAASLTINAAANAGSAADALWVDAATVAVSATNGGVWVNDASTAPVTLTSITAGGTVVFGSQGNLLVNSVNAGSHSATLNSVHGTVLDGVAGGSSADHPNVIAAAVTVNAATNAGSASHALWVDAAAISGSAASGGVWINDAASGPVTLASITTGGGPVVIGAQSDLDVQFINAGAGSVALTSASGAVLDSVAGGASISHPNITAGSVILNTVTGAGKAGNALWVNAATVAAIATNGGIWISDAAATPVTLTSIVAGAGPVVIGSQGNLLVDSVNAGASSASLNSAHGAVLDGIPGGANAGHPNVVAGSVIVNAAAGAGSAGHALWIDAAAISASAVGGGVWISDAAATPVTVTSVTAGGGPVVIASQGNLIIDSVNAGNGSVTLNSITGGVLDGIAGGSSASHVNVTAGSVTFNAVTGVGRAEDALWVDAATINAAVSAGGVWINDAAMTPATLVSITAAGGPVVVNSQGDLRLVSVNAGSGDVTLGSVTGSILDGISGGASVANPNVTGGIVTLTAAKTVGVPGDRIYVSATSYTATAPSGVFVNTPLTPYPGLPLVAGVSPVTVYDAIAQTQMQMPQDLPITLIGQPMRMAPPIAVTADLLGIDLPAGVESSAIHQDSTMNTGSAPIIGGNDDEVGRTKVNAKVRKKGVKQSKLKPPAQTTWQG